MWELYAFWAFVPVMLTVFATTYPEQQLNVSRWSFIIIGFGAVACVMGGYLSQTFRSKTDRHMEPHVIGLCCLLSPLVLNQPSEILFLTFLFFWGFLVIADSPLFSADCSLCAAGNKRNIPDHCQLHWFFYNHSQYSAAEFSFPDMGQSVLIFNLGSGPAVGVIALIRHRPVT